MKYLKYAAIILSLTVMAVSCKNSPQMTPEAFLQIEDEVNTTDLTPESKSKVAKKYGFTLEQYQSFEERAKTDKKLQEQLGAIRLKPKNQ